MEGEDNLFVVSPRHVPHGSATHASPSNTQNRLATRAIMIWDTFAGCPAVHGALEVLPPASLLVCVWVQQRGTKAQVPGGDARFRTSTFTEYKECKLVLPRSLASFLSISHHFFLFPCPATAIGLFLTMIVFLCLLSQSNNPYGFTRLSL